jgi:hypothetical protein
MANVRNTPPPKAAGRDFPWRGAEALGAAPEGLGFERFEAHSCAQLLPARIEMRQRKSSDDVTPQ